MHDHDKWAGGGLHPLLGNGHAIFDGEREAFTRGAIDKYARNPIGLQERNIGWDDLQIDGAIGMKRREGSGDQSLCLRSHPKTSFDCDWLQSPWIRVVGEKGSRRTSVRLRAFFTSALTTGFSLNLVAKLALG